MLQIQSNIPVIASGGVGKLEHLYEGLQTGKASAVLAASIFHFGEFSIKQVKEYLKSNETFGKIIKMLKDLEELISIVRDRKKSEKFIIY